MLAPASGPSSSPEFFFLMGILRTSPPVTWILRFGNFRSTLQYLLSRPLAAGPLQVCRARPRIEPRHLQGRVPHELSYR